MLTDRVLRKGLRTRSFGHKIYSFDTIDSTNNCAKAVAACGADEGTVVFSEHQTEGRGRLGRSWFGNPGENLAFSIVLRPKTNMESLNLVPLFVGVAIAEAVEKSMKVQVECKWPNDLLVDGRKFCGILIESSMKQNQVEHIVVGVGVNVNQVSFPDDFLTPPTSLRIVTGQELDRAKLFRDILTSLEQNYLFVSSRGFQSILPHWLSRTTMINSRISVSHQGGVVSGVVKGITNDGGLILQTATAEQTLFAGDVTIVPR